MVDPGLVLGVRIALSTWVIDTTLETLGEGIVLIRDVAEVGRIFYAGS